MLIHLIKNVDCCSKPSDMKLPELEFLDANTAIHTNSKNRFHFVNSKLRNIFKNRRGGPTPFLYTHLVYIWQKSDGHVH